MGKFADLVALAKAGYSPAEVKEILKVAGGTETDKPEEAAEILPKEEAQHEQPKQESVEEPKAPEDNSNAAMNELRLSVQKLTTELEQAKKDLAAAQKLNTSKPAGQKVPEKTVDDIVRAFM